MSGIRKNTVLWRLLIQEETREKWVHRWSDTKNHRKRNTRSYALDKLVEKKYTGGIRRLCSQAVGIRNKKETAKLDHRHSEDDSGITEAREG